MQFLTKWPLAMHATVVHKYLIILLFFDWVELKMFFFILWVSFWCNNVVSCYSLKGGFLFLLTFISHWRLSNKKCNASVNVFWHLPAWIQVEQNLCVPRWNCTGTSAPTTCCGSAPEFVRCWRGRSLPACPDSPACWGPAGRISSAPARVSRHIVRDVAQELLERTHVQTHPPRQPLCYISLHVCVD